MKIIKPRRGSTKFILKTVKIPDGLEEQLTEEEQALLKYALSSMNIKELSEIYGQRDRTTKIELIWRLISLGQTLAYSSLFNNHVFLDWKKVKEQGNAYMQGFLDCKTQVKKVIDYGLRKESGRKA
jgi:hypothetical protein